jgi:2-C-methyl-D-erythritol 4-phosphate cytidylyltransferase / 2-C-methyl-D-erythritol 2,4-cyclodiphosphate synthase
MVAVVVVAAGKGKRMNSDIPKQYARFPDGKMILRHTLDHIFALPDLMCVQVVISPSDFSYYEHAVQGLDKALLLPPAFGKETRQQSVFQGLISVEAHYPKCKAVIVHDAARPFADIHLFQEVVTPILSGEAVAVYPAIPSVDTLRMISDEKGIAGETLDRTQVHAVQTPQAFDFNDLLDAHVYATDQGQLDLTDDIVVMQWAGHTAHYTSGSPLNFKITTPDDMYRATTVLRIMKRDQQVISHVVL